MDAIEKIHILEGNSFKLDGGSMFGNAPKVVWERWMPPDELNRISLTSRCLLIQTEMGNNILIETGIGTFFSPKFKERYGVETDEHLLLKNLRELGVEPDQIGDVILTHLHFDHAGGLLASLDEIAFPNADIHVGKMHWEHAHKPPQREQASFIPEMLELIERSGRLQLAEHTLPFDFNLKPHFYHGHTVGLMVIEIPLPGGPLYFTSDLVPGKHWVHLPITMGYDRYAELVSQEKQRFYGESISKNGTLVFVHDPETACVQIERKEGGVFTYVEASMPPVAVEESQPLSS